MDNPAWQQRHQEELNRRKREEERASVQRFHAGLVNAQQEGMAAYQANMKGAARQTTQSGAALRIDPKIARAVFLTVVKLAAVVGILLAGSWMYFILFVKPMQPSAEEIRLRHELLQSNANHQAQQLERAKELGREEYRRTHPNSR